MLTKTDRATQNVRIRLLLPVSEYGSIPIRLFVRTKLNAAHTLRKRGPFPSTSFPRFATKRDATISSTKSDSSSSRIKSSSSSSSAPLKRKNAARNEIKFSSHARAKSLCPKKNVLGCEI